MKPYMAYPRNMDVRPIGSVERIRKRDAGELVPLTFEFGLLGQLFQAPLPGRICGVEHPLQGMTRYADLFAVVREQIVECVTRVIDAVLGIQFHLTDGPIP